MADNDTKLESTRLDPCLPKIWLRTFNLILVTISLLILINSIKEFRSIQGDSDPEIMREKMRLIGATTASVGIVMWPVVWDTLVGYSVLTYHPLTLFGFLWPMVMSMIDLTYISSAKNAVQAEKIFGIGELATDANTLIGVAFAVGSILSSQTNTQLANASIPLLMYSLLLLIAFIVPTPSLDPNDYSGFAVGTIQRTFFNYAMGMVITGISINVAGQSGPALQRALKQTCVQRGKQKSTTTPK